MLSASQVEKLLSTASKRGACSIVILKLINSCFAWQRKTPGYPVPNMVGGLCLFGGNKEVNDKTSRETLIRELREELPAAWCEEIEKTLTPFSRYVIEASKEVMNPKDTYSFIACVYYATLNEALKTGGESSEGVFELVPMKHLLNPTEKFCWGYDVVFNDYLNEIAKDHVCRIMIREDFAHCSSYRIQKDQDIGIWATSEIWK